MRAKLLSLATPSDAEAKSHFRAVKSGDYRRGIRLEQIFWKTLHKISAAEGASISDLVVTVEDRLAAVPNVTSALRVMCAGWLINQLAEARAKAGPAMVESLVQASPAPTFALAEDKRILVYNQAFIQFIYSRVPLGNTNASARDLRLSLDMPINDVIRQLGENGNRPVVSGFLIGIEERRIRGRLNLVLAPNVEQTVVVGYVLPG